ncbi:MAG: GNAT family N-acetyltransferase [Peptococcaceae bacterium]|nr:GNAT family N-acetyltransferase [Peptococcaceae bacterium]
MVKKTKVVKDKKIVMKVVTLDQISLKALTEVWNLCWSQSLMKGTDTQPYLKVEHLKAYLLIHKIALPYSIGLTVNGELIGFSFLGINKEDAWIGSLGILPWCRGKGLSRVLLSNQLSICDKMRLRHLSLEVDKNNFVSKVYRSFGFQTERELTHFVLSKKELYYLDVYRYDQYCYQKVSTDSYFAVRKMQGNLYPWKRKDYILKNYKKTACYLGPEGASGYILQGGGMVIDIWAVSGSFARSTLSSISGHLDTIRINNQIRDPVAGYLLDRSIEPVGIHFEMSRNS